MRRLVLTLALALMCTGILLAQTAPAKNVVLGTWDCVAKSNEEVPFTLVVSEEDGKLSVVVKLDQGDLEGFDAKIDGNRITFQLMIENSPHSVEGTVTTDKIEGKYEGDSAQGTFSGTRKT